jgi:hypothetical protein
MKGPMEVIFPPEPDQRNWLLVGKMKEEAERMPGLQTIPILSWSRRWEENSASATEQAARRSSLFIGGRDGSRLLPPFFKAAEADMTYAQAVERSKFFRARVRARYIM